MRTRTRSVVLDSLTWPATNVSFTQYFCNGSTSSGNQVIGTYSKSMSYLEEVMRDSLGRGKPNYVFHRRKLYKASNAGYVIDQAIGTAPYGHTVYNGTSQLGSLTNSDVLDGVAAWDVTGAIPGFPSGWTIDSSQINESALDNDVREAARQLKADVLLNLVEANQLWPSVKGLLSTAPKWRNLENNWQYVRKLLKWRSNQYLSWKFGISPFLSDLSSSVNYMSKLKQDLERHAKGESSRFSKKGVYKFFFAKPPVDASMNGVLTSRQSFQGRLESTPEVRYVLVVKPKVQYQTQLFNALDLLMSRFSSTPASLAWEKVPFSFVVDWFVDLRGLCRTLDSCLGFEPYKILSYTRSMKYQLASDAFFERRSSCVSNDVLHSAACGSVTFSHYERSLVSSGVLPTWKPRFGKSQAAITAALISQRLKT